MRKILLTLLSFLLALPVNAACVCTDSISLDLEITSLYPAPTTGESEWIELFNSSSQDLDLSFYTLEDENAQQESLSGTITAGESLQVDSFSFALNNGGDTVTLRTIDGEYVDSLSYSDASSQEVITKNGNQEVELSSEEETPEEDPTPSTPATWPEFSEALPNPEGSDSSEEWIELYNPFGYELSLEGLYIDDMDGGSSTYALSGTLAANTYLEIWSEDSGISLNNSTDSIRLLGAEQEVLWEVLYDDPSEGESYALINEAYQWTDNPSPGEENIAGSSDSNESEYQNGDLSDEVEITEVFPNPEGADQDDEWIEITNGGDENVNLGNWTLDDGEGGSDPYTFPDDTIIEAGETLVIYRSISRIALNNSNETVQLKDFTGESMSDISYEKSVEGEAYAEIHIETANNLQASTRILGKRVESTWEWIKASPGELNPRVKEIQGTVMSFENGLLTLNDGFQDWLIHSEQSGINDILFKTGNVILVQSMQQKGENMLHQAELITSAAQERSKQKVPLEHAHQHFDWRSLSNKRNK